MNTLLVTGGAGFIGANLVHHLLRETDSRLMVIDKLTYAANPKTIDTWRDVGRVRRRRALHGHEPGLSDEWVRRRWDRVSCIGGDLRSPGVVHRIERDMSYERAPPFDLLVP